MSALSRKSYPKQCRNQRMKLCRVKHESFAGARNGVIEDAQVWLLSENQNFENAANQRSQSIAFSSAMLLAPVTPSKIVCVGRNYREHAAEMGNKMPDEPLLFLKAPSAVIGNDDCIQLPPDSAQVEHEGELGVVIGKQAHRLSPDDNPLNYVLGYSCVNDVTARDLQRKDVQFTRAKSFDTFCPVGPWIETELDPLNLVVKTRVNGIEKQSGRTKDMAFSVPLLIRYIANVMTLFPGDLLVTGTPAGVSPLKPGDIVEVEINGIGILQNTVCDVD
jgi:2-keto-4-pentenoate hydratase/2-oxohepta-3-ene-1,7-dioic acid hydratase in catechol pathway